MIQGGTSVVRLVLLLVATAAVGDDVPKAAEARVEGIVVMGRVVDAEDGQPIRQFQLVPSSDYADGHRGTWQPHLLAKHAGGRYEYRSERPWERTRFRVEAAGYRPGISRAVKKTEGAVTIDFALQRDPGLAGLVRAAEGAPVGAARVMYATESRTAQVTGGMLTSGGFEQSLSAGVVVTGPDGTFRLPPEADPGMIVAAHLRHGYAEVLPGVLAAKGDVTLRPWGRVEGQVLAGETPVPGRLVTLWSSRPSGSRQFMNSPIHLSEEATTDAAGRFAFPRVAPGRADVNRVTRTKDGWTSVFGTAGAIEVVERGTTRVTLGGPGRAVIGRLRPPRATMPVVDWSRFSIRMSLPAPHIGFGGDDASWAEYRRFAQSAEGRPYFLENQPVKPDGTFRLEGVPQGYYDLWAWAAAGGRPTVLAVSTRVDVPATANGRGDAIDLGDLPIREAAMP